MRASGDGAARVNVVIRPAILPQIAPIRNVEGDPFPLPGDGVALRTDEAGAFRSPRLSAGAYVVRTEPDGTSDALVVEVEPGETSRVELVTSAFARGVPPLRNAHGGPPSDAGSPTRMTLEEAARVLVDAQEAIVPPDQKGISALAVRRGNPETREPARFWGFHYCRERRAESIRYPLSLPGVYFKDVQRRGSGGAIDPRGPSPFDYVDESGQLFSVPSFVIGLWLPSAPYLVLRHMPQRCVVTDDFGNSLEFCLGPRLGGDEARAAAAGWLKRPGTAG